MTDGEIVENFIKSNSKPTVIEAFWDGDTSGWFVILVALFKSDLTSNYQEKDIAVLQGEGGDIRLFNNQVPEWIESVRAKNIGEMIARHYNIQFYFVSPDYPEDDCPRWQDREKGYPCLDCGISLLQNETCPWKGYCYRCHLRSKK